MPTAARHRAQSAPPVTRAHARDSRTFSGRITSRIANPVVRAVLRSSVHDLLSDSVVLIEYRGRRSGWEYATPASYLRDDDALTLLSRRRRQWWRNLEEASPVHVVLSGQRLSGRAWVYPASPLWQKGQAPAVTAAIGVLGGIVMAATMAAVTGAGLVGLLAHRGQRQLV